MSEWKSIILGQLSKDRQIEIRTGPFGSQLHQSDYVDDGIPIVMPKDIVDWNICTDTIARTSSEMVEKLRIHQLRSGDIVYGRRGDIGRHAFVSEHEESWLCGTGCIRLRLLNDAPIIPRFLSFFLRLPNTINSIYNQAVGSTMPNLNTGIIENIIVNYPDVNTQKKTVGALRTYDDLIKNNTRRIAILEEMAKKLYREWFVHFRFPGHENVKMVESEMGLIPEGWEVSTIETNTTLLRRGITPKYDDAASKTVVNQKCVRNFSVDMSAARQQSKDYPDELNLQYGDILINSTGAGTLGRVGQFFDNVVDTTVDSHVTIVRPQKKCIYYLGLILKSLQSKLMDMGVGSTNQTELNRDLIKCIRVVLPTDEVLNTFERAVNNWMTLKRQLVSQNINLHKTRDLLLPRLISGDIDVAELDIPIKEG